MDWQEACESPYLRDLPFKIELNQWGQVVMSPAKNQHSVFQGRVLRHLSRLMADGETIPECSIQTSDNIKVADAAWISPERYQQVKEEMACSSAPEICVEVRSASHSQGEMNQKMALYFEAGALEVWFCGEDGRLSFYSPGGRLDRSRIFADFPNRVDTQGDQEIAS